MREFNINDFVHFDVTGILYRTERRFKCSYTGYYMAMGINLWRGSIWGVLPSGKRRLLKRVWN